MSNDACESNSIFFQIGIHIYLLLFQIVIQIVKVLPFWIHIYLLCFFFQIGKIVTKTFQVYHIVQVFDIVLSCKARSRPTKPRQASDPDQLLHKIVLIKIRNTLLNDIYKLHWMMDCSCYYKQLKNLEAENNQLKEVQGKAFWCSGSKDEGQISQTVKNARKFWIPLLRSHYKGNGVKGDNMRCRDKWKDGKGSKSEMSGASKVLSEACGLIHPSFQDTMTPNFRMDNVLEQRRQEALSHSFFSAVWSLLVGMIVWEAREPCMPLVLALFVVVIMSLMCVLRFFSTIKNKHAVVAVALLSLNCFMLGMVTCPMLPVFADALAPFVFHASQKMVTWFLAFLT